MKGGRAEWCTRGGKPPRACMNSLRSITPSRFVSIWSNCAWAYTLRRQRGVRAQQVGIRGFWAWRDAPMSPAPLPSCTLCPLPELPWVLPHLPRPGEPWRSCRGMGQYFGGVTRLGLRDPAARGVSSLPHPPAFPRIPPHCPASPTIPPGTPAPAPLCWAPWLCFASASPSRPSPPSPAPWQASGTPQHARRPQHARPHGPCEWCDPPSPRLCGGRCWLLRAGAGQGEAEGMRAR